MHSGKWNRDGTPTHTERQVKHKVVRVKVARVVAAVGGEREDSIGLAPPRRRVHARRRDAEAVPRAIPGAEDGIGRGRADLERDAGVVAGPEPDADAGAEGPAADEDEEAAAGGVEGGPVGRGRAELDAAALVEVDVCVAVGRGHVSGEMGQGEGG